MSNFLFGDLALVDCELVELAILVSP
jgi:hypothetical protein